MVSGQGSSRRLGSQPLMKLWFQHERQLKRNLIRTVRAGQTAMACLG